MINARRAASFLVTVVLLVIAGGVDACAALPRPAKTAKVAALYDYGTDRNWQKFEVTYSTARTNAPWVMLIHGGSWANGTMAGAIDPAANFYAHGWQVFNIEYRQGAGITFPQELADVTAARDYIRAHAAFFHLDLDRGTVYGFSAGGHLATLVGLDGGFSVVVSVDGVLQPQRVAEDSLGARPETEPVNPRMTGLYQHEVALMGCAYEGVSGESACSAAWRAFCPEFSIAPTDTAFYLVHGGADPVVPYQSTQAFSYWLGKQAITRSVVLVPGGGHVSDNAFDGGPREAAMRAFILRHGG